MSGRLSPQVDNQIQAFPSNYWKDEFKSAKACGFDTIEWVFDLNPNPILQNDGLDEMHNLSNKYGIAIKAVCADYFMQKMLFSTPEPALKQNLAVLRQLIQQCSKLGIAILEIPFVDSSSLRTQNHVHEMIENLHEMVDFATSQNVRITLETDLAPADFSNLLKKFGPNVGANYDTGNSTALGYDPKEELQMLKPWLANIHIKDRLYHGNTVPLGSGDADFDSVFSVLAKINYNGQLIIQGAREDNVFKPQDTCKKYLEFVQSYVTKYDLSNDKVIKQ